MYSMKLSCKVIAVVVALSFLFIPKTYAALLINEFSSATPNSDWVEIYNPDNTSVDLSGYILRDSTTTNKKDLTGTIAGTSYAVFDWDNNLNKDGDTIRLLKTDESPVDQVTYGSSANVVAPSDTQTAGRLPDGSSNWVLFSSATKGSANTAPTVAPTPTPSPTSTPAPSNTPTPTPTKSPTPTPTPTPAIVSSPTPTPGKLTPTVIPTIDPNREGGTISATTASPDTPVQGILGNNTGFENLKSGVDSGGGTSYSWGKLFIVMGVVLVGGACGILLYNNYRKQKGEELST